MLNGFHLHIYDPSAKWRQGKRVQGEIDVMVCLAFLSFDAEVMRETENFFLLFIDDAERLSSISLRLKKQVREREANSR